MAEPLVPAVGPCRWCGQPAHEADESGQPAHHVCTRWAAEHTAAAAVLTVLAAFPGTTVAQSTRQVIDDIAALVELRRSA